MGETTCWVCGFQGTDVDLHIGQVGDIIREAPNLPHWSEWSLHQLVDHRLHLQMQKGER